MIIAVRATPRASQSRIEGAGTDSEGRAVLLVRIAAPPVEGAANTALVALLAKALGVRKRDITVQSGGTARHKRLHVAGESGAIGKRLEALLAG